MKVSPLIIAVLLGLLAYGIWSPNSPMRKFHLLPWSDEPRATSEAPAPPPPTAEEVAQARRDRRVHIANFPRVHLHGIISQHLPDGHLLIHGYALARGQASAGHEDLALFDYPSLASVPDGSGIECQAGDVGAYEFAVDSRSKRTVRELEWTESEAFDELPKWDRFGHPINRDPSAPAIPAGDDYRNPFSSPPHL